MSTQHVFPFTPSTPASTGVEMEWIIIDRESAAQCPLAPDILQQYDAASSRIKPELFTSTVEINTDIHHSTDACIRQLHALTDRVRCLLEPLHGDILASGTHPFSHWRRQIATGDPRYARLLERLQWTVQRVYDKVPFYREAFRAGQKDFPVHTFPFRLTEANMAAHAGSPWSDFWRNLKEGYDMFERTRIPPVVAVRGGRYVFYPAMEVIPESVRLAMLSGVPDAPVLIEGLK